MDHLVSAMMTWFANSARDLPWRRTRDPYAIWVSEIMLQQTQVTTVIPYYERWMRSLPTIQSLARASSARLHKLWEGLGYYSRVRNMQKAARIIFHEYGGQFPRRFEDVIELPGIGPYTAGAICSIAFNQPKPILDGNVIRVLTRVYGIMDDPRSTQTNARLWQLAETLVVSASGSDVQLSRAKSWLSKKKCSVLNQALMELGATICTPRNPKCSRCPVMRSCNARRFGLTESIPLQPRRSHAIKKAIRILVPVHDGRFWVIKRPETGINAGLWQFPLVEDMTVQGKKPNRRTADLTASRLKTEFIGTFKQAITNHLYTAEVYLYRTGAEDLGLNSAGRWFSQTSLKRIPMTAMHRRIANHLLNLDASQIVPRDESGRTG